jgi:hypothetical protein
VINRRCQASTHTNLRSIMRHVNRRPNPVLRAPRRSPTSRQTAELEPLIDHLREVARGRDDIRTECAGTIAGTWFSSIARRGEDLIAAGLLMLAGPVDHRPVRPGSRRARRALAGVGIEGLHPGRSGQEYISRLSYPGDNSKQLPQHDGRGER